MARALHDAGTDVHVITGVPHYPQWRDHAAYRRGVRWSEPDNGMREVPQLKLKRPELPWLRCVPGERWTPIWEGNSGFLADAAEAQVDRTASGRRVGSLTSNDCRHSASRFSGA